MLLEVKHPEFKNHKVEVKIGGLFSGPKLIVNGSEIKKKNGCYSIPLSSEREMTIQLKYNILDPVPKVKIKERILEIAEPLTWFEYFWIVAQPILLGVLGGSVGVIFGCVAAVANGRIFRSDKSVIAKYTLSFLLTLGALLANFLIVFALLFVLHWQSMT